MIVQLRVRHQGFYLSALNFCWNLSETVPQRQWKPKVCWQTLTAMTPRMTTTTRTKMAKTQTLTSNLISTTQKVVDDANARGPLLEFVLVLKQKLSHSGWCCIPTNCFSPQNLPNIPKLDTPIRKIWFTISFAHHCLITSVIKLNSPLRWSPIFLLRCSAKKGTWWMQCLDSINNLCEN